jgi:hypothetical protein
MTVPPGALMIEKAMSEFVISEHKCHFPVSVLVLENFRWMYAPAVEVTTSLTTLSSPIMPSPSRYLRVTGSANAADVVAPLGGAHTSSLINLMAWKIVLAVDAVNVVK